MEGNPIGELALEIETFVTHMKSHELITNDTYNFLRPSPDTRTPNSNILHAPKNS